MRITMISTESGECSCISRELISTLIEGTTFNLTPTSGDVSTPETLLLNMPPRSTLV